MWAAVRGGVGVACYTGGRQYWPTPWPSAVVASVRVAGWCAGWRPCRWCPSAVLAVGPWPWWPFSWPRRPFFGLASGGPSRPWLAGVLAVSGGSVPPPLAPVAAGVRCWCLRALLRRRWSRWPCRWPSLLVSLVSVSLRRAVARGPCRWPSVLAAVWRCAGGVIAPCRGGPCAVSVRPCWCPSWSVAGRFRPSVLVCWYSVGGWRPFLAVFLARGGPFGSSVVLVSVAGPCGPCGPCFGPCRLAGRVGLARVAAVAGGACACGGAGLVKERRPVAGWRWAVCGAFRGGGVRLPCLWSLLVSRQRRPWPSVYQRTKHQRPPWRPCWWCVLLACAGVGGVGVGGYILAPVRPRAAAVGRCAVGVTY